MCLLDAAENLRRGRSESLFQQPALGDPFLERLCHGTRLLVDLLQHVVWILALLGRVGRQLAVLCGALDRPAGSVGDPHAVTAHLGDVALLHEDEATGDGQQRGNVRGDEVLVPAETDDDRAPGPRKTSRPGSVR